jgi:hypothetical protein
VLVPLSFTGLTSLTTAVTTARDARFDAVYNATGQTRSG